MDALALAAPDRCFILLDSVRLGMSQPEFRAFIACETEHGGEAAESANVGLD